jgi:CRISPR-associated protein Cas2
MHVLEVSQQAVTVRISEGCLAIAGKEGFMALQYSVYARYYESEEASKACRRRVAAKVPELGRVRVLHVTERQFATMSVLFGKRIEPVEEPPDQLLLF